MFPPSLSSLLRRAAVTNPPASIAVLISRYIFEIRIRLHTDELVMCVTNIVR